MTRLTPEWVEYMIDGMDAYEEQLRSCCGLGLAELAGRAAGIRAEELADAQQRERVCVIPITQGLGIISSFAEAVSAIATAMGFDAETACHTDVDGIYDAHQAGREILLMADDTRYLALNTSNGKASDNNEATARGYITLLEAMAEHHGRSLSDAPVLLIGLGLVGEEAAWILSRKGIAFDVLDKQDVTCPLAGHVYSDPAVIRRYAYVLDMTNEGDWLAADMLAEDALYASPGVPYSLTSEAEEAMGNRAFHDNLEIGTAVMAADVI